MKKNYFDSISNALLFLKLSKAIHSPNLKILAFLFFFFSSLTVTYGQSCNVVKNGTFTGNANNWTTQPLLTGWHYSTFFPNEIYIEADGINNVSLKQSLTGLIVDPSTNSLIVSFKIKGQNAGRLNCNTTGELSLKIGALTYMTIKNPVNNTQIFNTDITVFNGATLVTADEFPLTVGRKLTDPPITLSQGTITLRVPWTAGAITADIEFLATSSNTPYDNVCGAGGGDDWTLDDITVTPSVPTTFAVTGSNVCTGSSTAIGLNGSQLGVSYQLQRGGVNVGTAVAGTGNALSFGNQNTVGVYTVVAVLTGTATCTTTMNGNVTINPLPTVANAGPDQTDALTCGLTSVILAGNTPTVGTGSWSIVSGNGGTVTTPSSSTSTFTGTAGTTYTLRWTISNSPCPPSTDDVIIKFNQNPVVSITGNAYICAGLTTTLSPATGGTWVSNNPSIATVTNAGVVTGVASGNATFTFTNTTTGCSATTAAITVSTALSTTYNSSGSFTVPAGVTSLQVEAWGAGGGGANVVNAAGGGGGGAYTRGLLTSLTAGQNLNVTVGVGGAAGGNGGSSSVGTIVANGGFLGNSRTGGAGGTASTVTGNVIVSYSGYNGGNARASTSNGNNEAGGGGGGSATTTGSGGSNGANGGSSTTALTAGGTGTGNGGGGAAAGGNPDAVAGNVPGGGGGGRGEGSSTSKSGASGRVVITILAPTATAGGSQAICPMGVATVNNATATNGTILWTHNGTGSLNNATGLTPTYTAAAGDTGNTVTLTMTVSNGPCVTPATATYTIIVNNIPTISAITAPAALCSGASLNPSAPTVTANGSTLSSQGWQISTTVGGSTYNSLTVPYTVSFADNGKNIRYTATNGCGTTTSNVVVLTVNNVPSISSITVPAALCSGASLNLTTPTVTTNGSALSSQGWQISTTVGGSTYNSLSVPYTVSFADNGKNIRYTATNGCGTTTSNVVVLIVNDFPTISAITTPAALCSGASLNLTTPTVTANGSTLSSQGWQMSTTVGGGTYASLTVPYTVSFADNGKNIRYTATNGCGTTTSNVVVLTVNNVPSISSITTPAALCSGASLNLTTPTVTTNGSALSSQGWQISTTVGGSTYNSLTVPYTVSFADNGKNIRYTATNGCGTTTSDVVALIVNDFPTISAITTPAALCSGASLNPATPTVTANGSALSSQGWQISTTVGGSTYNPLTVPYTVSFSDNGKNIRYTVTNACGTTTSNVVVLTVNSVTIPTAVATAQPNCSELTGTITLSGLPPSGTIFQTISGATTSILISGGGTQAISGLAAGNYTFTVSNGSCTSAASNQVTIVAFSRATVIWNGVSFTSTPTIEDRVEFRGKYESGSSSPVSPANVDACSCYVMNNAAVTFNSGHTLNVINEVQVLSGSLTFEDKASLVQHKDVPFKPNSGSITYLRKTTITRYDYTYWSSPVVGRTLYQLSPYTLFDRYFTYNNGWVLSRSGAAEMFAGRGYIARGPQNSSISTPAEFTGIFVGEPHNGVYNDIAVVPNIDYLLGNPYPSAIDADKFIDANATRLQGTLYFWTHNTEPVAAQGTTTYKYTASDYASYNRTGGAGTAGIGVQAVSKGKIPTGKIGAGQGFFVRAIGTGNVLFNNSMRLAATQTTYLDNAQFFKLDTGKNAVTAVTTTEKNRVWLNLTNAEGAFKQILVGYITGATNEYDNGFDGVTYNGNSFVDFYSVNQDKNLVIQGRALPFVKKDSVALGYKTTIKGDFKISIDQLDGIFTTQNVLLEDKELKVQHDLKKEAYTFSTEKGTFNNRFVLRYVDKNAVDEVVIPENPGEDAAVMVSVKDQEIKINSMLTKLDRVVVYDVAGRKLFQKNKIDANVLFIPHFVWNHQVLVVDVVLMDGTKVSKKIIN